MSGVLMSGVLNIATNVSSDMAKKSPTERRGLVTDSAEITANPSCGL